MSPVAVQTGNGVADEEAERLGGASQMVLSYFRALCPNLNFRVS